MGPRSAGPPVAGRSGGPAPPDHRQHHPADPDPIQHPADQLRLGRPRLLVCEQLVVAPERLQDRRLGLADAQVPDAHVVLEQVGDAALEPVQPGQRVLADGDQEAHRQVGPVDRRRELGGEAARAVLVPVVEEPLLELVQDHQQLQVPAGRPGGEGPGQPPGRVRLGRAGLPEHPRDLLADPVQQPGDRVAGPLVDVDHHQPGRAGGVVGPGLLLAQLVHHPGPQDRALADPAGPVDQGELGRHQVGGQDGPFGVPAEEERGVALGVRLQPLVGGRPRPGRGGQGRVGRGRLAHQPTPPVGARSRCAVSPTTYSSRDVSRTSTPRRCQNSSSIGLGSSWMAHDL